VFFKSALFVLIINLSCLPAIANPVNCRLEKCVALTFDDGPTDDSTTKILQILRQNNAKATFFMIGQNVKNNPAIAQLVLSQGHEIGNHSYTHPNLNQLKSREIASELSQTQDQIFATTGLTPTLFRPPFGLTSDKVHTAAKNLKLVMWDIDSEDWLNPETQKICDKVEPKVFPGAIVLLHDRIEESEAVQKIITFLLAKNYKFVTISQLTTP
jgi:peptidoglycan-N-acetylglucosamine deacetylase